MCVCVCVCVCTVIYSNNVDVCRYIFYLIDTPSLLNSYDGADPAARTAEHHAFGRVGKMGCLGRYVGP